MAHGFASSLRRRPGVRFKVGHGMDARHVAIPVVGPNLSQVHHGKLTFRMVYAFAENFVLALSHDEVVYGKGSLLGKMPGDDWRKFANLRLLFGYLYAQPGKKLLFMGDEFGQRREWNHDNSLDWQLLEYPPHQGLQKWLTDVNHLYRALPALHEMDCDPAGFEWIDCNDSEQSTLIMIRKTKTTDDMVLIAFNFTPVPRQNYRVGVPEEGFWKEALNSDALIYGGAGWGNLGGVEAVPVRSHGRPFSLSLTLPPLSALFLTSGGPTRGQIQGAGDASTGTKRRFGNAAGGSDRREPGPPPITRLW